MATPISKEQQKQLAEDHEKAKKMVKHRLFVLR